MPKRRRRVLTHESPAESAGEAARSIPASPAWLRPRLAACGIVGVGLCIAIGDRNGWTVAQLVALAAAIVIALVPASRRGVVRSVERLRGLDHSGERGGTVVCFVVALLYLLGAAYVQGRD